MKKWIFWVVALAALAALQMGLEGFIGAYYYGIVIYVGINIILAVSLNLINGITGQFSLGHAGFMAIGAYAAGSLVKYFAPSGAAHRDTRWTPNRPASDPRSKSASRRIGPNRA